jgi:hypothetical protein
MRTTPYEWPRQPVLTTKQCNRWTGYVKEQFLLSDGISLKKPLGAWIHTNRNAWRYTMTMTINSNSVPLYNPSTDVPRTTTNGLPSTTNPAQITAHLPLYKEQRPQQHSQPYTGNHHRLLLPSSYLLSIQLFATTPNHSLIPNDDSSKPTPNQPTKSPYGEQCDQSRP